MTLPRPLPAPNVLLLAAKLPHAPIPGFTVSLLPALRLIRRELPWGHWLPYIATREQAEALEVEREA